MSADIIAKLELDSTKWEGVLEVEADLYERGIAATIRVLSKGEELMITLFNNPDSYELIEPYLWEEELVDDYGQEVADIIIEAIASLKSAMIAYFLDKVDKNNPQ